MFIPLDTEEIFTLAESYKPPGGKPPITKTRPIGDVKSQQYWLTNANNEKSLKFDWKKRGVALYLKLSSTANLGEGCFPVEFTSNSGRKFWADKAIVKTCIQDKLASFLEKDGELIVCLNQNGMSYLKQEVV